MSVVIEEIRMRALEVAERQGHMGDYLLDEADKITVWILTGQRPSAKEEFLVETQEKSLTNNKK